MNDVLLDRYELRGLLGAGGMARVYEGYDRALARRVAVKVLRDDLAMPDVRERFVREARTAAAFTHPNAVAVFDTGQEGRSAFIVMELVEGGSLADALAGGALPADRAVDIAIGVLSALDAAHRQGLVHRDVKPANILIPHDGTPKLADFGIAKSVEDAAANLTATGQLLGTPRYLAPEQVLGHPATARSDLYATGVVLYEMLAGRPPFSGPTPMAVAFAHQDQPPPPLADARPGLHPRIVSVVERALEKDPQRRYPDAPAMAQALRAAGGGAPGTPPPAVATTQQLSPARESDEAAGRPRGWSTVPVVLAVLLLLGLAGFALTRGGGTTPEDTAPPPGAGDAQAPEQLTPPDEELLPEEPAPDEPGVPEDLPSLIQVLAADPDAYGEKGGDLFDLLVKVVRADGGKQAKEARDAQAKVEDWVSNGELDPAIGATAIRLLAPVAGPPGQTQNDDDGDDDD